MMILVCAIYTAHCFIYSSGITTCTLHPYTCFSLLLCTYYHWYWLPYGKADTSDSVCWFSMLMLSFQSFWFCMWEKFPYLICEGLVPAPQISTQKASIGMYAIVTIILVHEFLALSSRRYWMRCEYCLICEAQIKDWDKTEAS